MGFPSTAFTISRVHGQPWSRGVGGVDALRRVTRVPRKKVAE